MRISMSKIRFKPIIIKYKKAHINGAIENRSTVGICLYDEDTKCETKSSADNLIVAKAMAVSKNCSLSTLHELGSCVFSTIASLSMNLQ